MLRIGVHVTAVGPETVAFVREAERLGVDAVWAPEFWAGDAFTPLAYLAGQTERIRLGTAIVQLGARTPAMLAMTAMSMQALSQGRFVLGVGTSGPQVMEGWHGVRFDRPIQRTRETIEIIRKVSAGERLVHDGEVYRLPLPDGEGMGEGKAIRSMLPPTRVAVYVAALGPSNLRLTGELADGWIGNSFLPETAEVFLGPIREGAAVAGRSLDDLDLTVAASVELTDDVEEAGRRHAEGYAFTFGTMGSPTRNFYNDAFARQGFGDDVREVQRLWMAGDKEGARKRVPVEIGLRTNLIGTDEMVRDRLRLYRDAGITMIRAGLPSGPVDAQLADLDRLLDLVRTVNDEAAAVTATTPAERT